MYPNVFAYVNLGLCFSATNLVLGDCLWRHTQTNQMHTKLQCQSNPSFLFCTLPPPPHLELLHASIALHNYTERQKKLITSSEWHSLKSTASKWFIFGHRLGKFILNKHILKKQKFTSIKEEINAMKSQEVNFQKSQKLLASRAGSSKQTIARAAFATRHWNWMNSYWMFWIGRLRGARSVSSFCDFRKITFRDLTAFFSFLMRENLVFFRYSY